MRSPPFGLDVQFRDRGFEVALVGSLPSGVAGCFRLVVPVLFGLEVVFAFLCFGAFTEGDLVLDAALVVFAMGALAVTGVGFLLWRRVNRPGVARLVLDGDRLTFTSMDGEIRLSLGDIKGVDLIPVGLAIRPKKGPTHHVMMSQTSEPARRWLHDAIDDARTRFGTSADVPQSLDALKPR